jgi:hypothetical protein
MTNNSSTSWHHRSADGDFARFAGLRWQNPITAA